MNIGNFTKLAQNIELYREDIPVQISLDCVSQEYLVARKPLEIDVAISGVEIVDGKHVLTIYLKEKN